MAAAFAFVFSPDGKMLLLKENEKKRKYMWDLPGGTLTDREAPLSGLHREVREETGLSVTVLSQSCWLKWDHHQSGNPILVAFYLAGTDSREVTVSEEHTAYRWVTPAEYTRERLRVSAEESIVADCFARYREITAGG
ncbi:NUDIX hydrolase [Streptomyces sp. NBC_01716]|uniref:NUDIX hydrolase n=1 Tax=Streptomyces sp. NBC_01716 TaxID=2975917 RepID=UPI002E31B088|nr:NUDIX hydrolase [Streptomyces sp. NBC_01716]